MKNLFIICSLFIFFPYYLSAQVGINTTNPQATLDIEGNLRLSPSYTGNEPEKVSSNLSALYVDRSTGKVCYAPEGFNKISGGTRPGQNYTITTFTPDNTLADVRFVSYVHKSNLVNNSDTAAYVFGDFKVIAMGPDNLIKFIAVNIRNADDQPKKLTTKNDSVISWKNGKDGRYGTTSLILNRSTGALRITNGYTIFSYFFQILGGL